MVKTALLLSVGLAFFCASAPAAQGSCTENGSLFWGDATQGYNSTGTEQNLVVRKHSVVAAGCATNSQVAGGTAHESPQNGNGALVEVGWRDRTNSNGDHYYRLFMEGCTSVGCSVTEYSSACATDGTTVTMEIRNFSPGTSQVWSGYYACNGGGFTFMRNYNPGFFYANDRVETFRFGDQSNAHSYIKDFHNSLQHWDKVGDHHSNMGNLVCDLGMSGTYGDPNANPATSYQTVSSGSC